MIPSKVAVVFVGTGRYVEFLPEWLSTCDQLLLPGIEKKYFIFTDANIKNATHIEQEAWPLPTLYKFKYINTAAESMYPDCDWLIFMDADMKIVSAIEPLDLLPEGKTFFGVHHPCLFYQDSGAFDSLKPIDYLENNVESLAAIDFDSNPDVYYQACFWGGRLPQTLAMSKEIEKRIDNDLSRGVVAKWHDESHLNKFYLENLNQTHTLPPIYAYPQNFPPAHPGGARIIHLDKDTARYRLKKH
jgi:hypothetical protein